MNFSSEYDLDAIILAFFSPALTNFQVEVQPREALSELHCPRRVKCDFLHICRKARGKARGQVESAIRCARHAQKD